MCHYQIGCYARVSNERQAEAKTIESQLAALRERIAQDGLHLSEELTFIDNGYSGATLIRPGLEQLRDVAAMHGLDRLYVHSPDRLARKYAYQALLLNEFERAGVEVIHSAMLRTSFSEPSLGSKSGRRTVVASAGHDRRV